MKGEDLLHVRLTPAETLTWIGRRHFGQIDPHTPSRSRSRQTGRSYPNQTRPTVGDGVVFGPRCEDEVVQPLSSAVSRMISIEDNYLAKMALFHLVIPQLLPGGQKVASGRFSLRSASHPFLMPNTHGQRDRLFRFVR